MGGSDKSPDLRCQGNAVCNDSSYATYSPKPIACSTRKLVRMSKKKIGRADNNEVDKSTLESDRIDYITCQETSHEMRAVESD